jgi:hypothetical protein
VLTQHIQHYFMRLANDCCNVLAAVDESRFLCIYTSWVMLGLECPR